ncbi:MAG TPA: DUF4397 domain-containing protein [Deltaproteobacteria bacterium]|nr:DUF4397 domain-containing protein [Deltaproteobacteria bacterium]
MKKTIIMLACAGILVAGALGCDDDDDDDIVGEEVLESEFRVIHTGVGVPQVDVYLDDTLLIEALDHGESSGYEIVPSGAHTIEVTPAGSTDTMITLDEHGLEPQAGTTLFIMGSPADFRPVVTIDSQDPAADKAFVRFVHAAPDVPAVDVRTGSEGGAPVFEGVSFGVVTEYTELRPGGYIFVITDSENAAPVAAFEEAEIEAGNVYSFTVLGTLTPGDEHDFMARVYVDNDGGDAFAELVPEMLQQPQAGDSAGTGE